MPLCFAALLYSATHPLRCSGGRTPLELAINANQSDVVAYLQTAAAAASAQVHVVSCAAVALCPLNPLLTPLLRVTIVLQAAAAARIAGRGDIFKAAKDGDLELVRDHVAADPASVHKRDKEYDSHPYTRF